jgi:hypothetical protein
LYFLRSSSAKKPRIPAQLPRPSSMKRCCGSVRSNHGTSIGTPSAFAARFISPCHARYFGFVHGSIAPSSRVFERSGMIRLGSKSIVLPNPWQRGHAPNGLLKLNNRGSGSRYARWHVEHSNADEKRKLSAASPHPEEQCAAQSLPPRDSQSQSHRRAATYLRRERQPVDQHINRPIGSRAEVQLQQGFRRGKLNDLSRTARSHRLPEPVIAAPAQLAKPLLQRLAQIGHRTANGLLALLRLRLLRSLLRSSHHSTAASTSRGPASPPASPLCAQSETAHTPAFLRHRQHARHNLVHRVAPHDAAAVQAGHRSAARIEQRR